MMPSAQFPDLEGASVLITGGGSGIGAALTEGFVAAGLQGRLHRHRRGTQPGALRPAREVRRQRGRSTSNADLRDIEALRAAVAEAAGAHGPATVLVNNAAFDERHDAARTSRSITGTTTRRSTCARISSPRRRWRRA